MQLFDAERRGRHDLRFAPLLRFPRRAWEREKLKGYGHRCGFDSLGQNG